MQSTLHDLCAVVEAKQREIHVAILGAGVEMGLHVASEKSLTFSSSENSCFRSYLGHRLIGEADGHPCAFSQKKENMQTVSNLACFY